MSQIACMRVRFPHDRAKPQPQTSSNFSKTFKNNTELVFQSQNCDPNLNENGDTGGQSVCVNKKVAQTLHTEGGGVCTPWTVC